MFQNFYEGVKLQNSPMFMHIIVRNNTVFHSYLNNLYANFKIQLGEIISKYMA